MKRPTLIRPSIALRASAFGMRGVSFAKTRAGITLKMAIMTTTPMSSGSQPVLSACFSSSPAAIAAE
ncbi:hypothetical protein D3C87_1663460 [compost metagenome]